MPNPIGKLALLLVVPFAFFAVWRWPPLRAALIVIVGSAMFLVANWGWDVPILPDLDKEHLPALVTLIAFVIMKRRALKARPFAGPEVLVLVGVVGTICTALLNSDPIVYGPVTLPAQTFYDGFVDAAGIVAYWFPPFFLGRALVTSSKDLKYVVRFFVLCGLIYTIPIMIEFRLSPQMHNWIYGFHQSDFVQTVRYGGYRPKVFMRHGLNVALFMTITTLFAVAMHKANKEGARLKSFGRHITPGRAAVFLLLITIFCKSTGAYFHLALMLPVIWFLSPRWQMRVALVLVVFVLTYPVLRANDMIPVDAITDWMKENVNRDRAMSLWFRMYTEGEVLARAQERIWFGWGGFGRPFIFDEVTGQQVSVLDGYWAIEIGNRGLVGFVATFGLVTWPVFSAIRAFRRIEKKADRRLIAAVSLMVVLYVFDWIPNSSLTPDLTFLSGGLAGAVAGILKEQRRRRKRLRLERTRAAREQRASREVSTASAAR